VGVARGFVRSHFVVIATRRSPRLGAAIYVGLFVTASSIASVVADHFGWLGFEEHAAGLARILGCALMVTGITLISIF